MKRNVMGLGIVLASIHVASAATIYQQPSVWAGNGTATGSAWTSQIDSGGNGFRTFDDFTLGSAATINQASWVGFYVNDSNLTNASPNTLNWVIRFYADNSGAPGSVLSSTSVPSAQVTAQVLGTGVFNFNGNTVDIYLFTAALPDFNAAAGTKYWFSPLSSATTFSPLFGWIQGTGGDNASFQTAFSGGSVTNTFVRSGDRAFTLSAVPEPSTLLPVGAALCAAAFLRRRRLESR